MVVLIRNCEEKDHMTTLLVGMITRSSHVLKKSLSFYLCFKIKAWQLWSDVYKYYVWIWKKKSSLSFITVFEKKIVPLMSPSCCLSISFFTDFRLLRILCSSISRFIHCVVNLYIIPVWRRHLVHVFVINWYSEGNDLTQTVDVSNLIVMSEKEF